MTNRLIESTAASIFTGGVTLQDLIKEIDLLE
jgi:ribosome-associated protein YbcJ (S4-like RNA binding protein)